MVYKISLRLLAAISTVVSAKKLKRKLFKRTLCQSNNQHYLINRIIKLFLQLILHNCIQQSKRYSLEQETDFSKMLQNFFKMLLLSIHERNNNFNKFPLN